MKTFQSTTEGAWVELLPLTKKGNPFSKREANEETSKRETAEVAPEKSTELSNFYTSIKPELKEEDTFQLITMDIHEKGEGQFTGILNCRVNIKHEQIRF